MPVVNRWIERLDQCNIKQGGLTRSNDYAVAGSASRKHKHDSHNTESFNNNFRGCCVWRKPAGGLKTRDVF